MASRYWLHNDIPNGHGRNAYNAPVMTLIKTERCIRSKSRFYFQCSKVNKQKKQTVKTMSQDQKHYSTA